MEPGNSPEKSKSVNAEEQVLQHSRKCQNYFQGLPTVLLLFIKLRWEINNCIFNTWKSLLFLIIVNKNLCIYFTIELM